jgi:hypothetical protein
MDVIMSDRDQENRLSTLNELEELNYYLSEDEEDRKEYEILTRNNRKLDLTHSNEENISFDSSECEDSSDDKEGELVPVVS